MRIAFFVQYCDCNGTYFRWHNLALALKLLGNEVDVYASDHNINSKIRIEYRDGIKYHIVPSLISTRLFYKPNDLFSALRRLCHLPNKEYDVYHLFQPFLHAFVSWWYLKFFKKKSIFIYDWDDLWTGGLFVKPGSLREWYCHLVTKFLENYTPRISDGITVCSDFLKNKVNNSSNVLKLGNGFWPSIIPIDKNFHREKWGLDSSVFYMAYIGKTAGELPWIIDGASFVTRNSRLKVKLLIAGPPENFVIPLIEGKTDYIEYLGSLSANDAKSLATAVDLGLVPLEDNLFNHSRFPIKFFDFLSVHTPVYVSNVGEIGIIGKEIKSVILGSTEHETWVRELAEVVVNLSKCEVQFQTESASLYDFSWMELAKKLLNYYNILRERY